MSETDGIGRAVLRRWWVVLLTIAAAVGASHFYTEAQSTVYRARTTLVVRPSSQVEGTSAILRSLDTLERRSIIATFAKIPATSRTRASVARQLEMSERDVRRYYVRGSVMPNTNIIQIEVLGPRRSVVAEVANAAASKTRREARSLYDIYSLDVLEPASAPRRPIYPDPERNRAAGGVLGLFLGIGAAILFDRVRGRSAASPATVDAAVRDEVARA